MGTEEELVCLKEDVGSLFEYSQKLVAENKSLRAILQRAVVFFDSQETEELYKSIAEGSHVFPTLRTELKVEDCSHSTLYSSEVDDKSVADDQPNFSHVQENGLPHSTISTTHSVSTASISQTLSGSGNERSNGIDVPQKKTPLKESSPDLSGHSQKSERSSGGGISVPVHGVLGVMGEGGRVQHQGLYVRDLTNILMKMSDLEERGRPETDTDVVSLTGEHVSDIVIAGCTQRQNEHVFVVHATWTNGQRFELYRKYRDFFTLQNALQKLFPEETEADVSQQTDLLPLRDHVLCIAGRLNSKYSLKFRERMVDNYCKAVVLAPSLKHSVPVIDFFMPRAGDKRLQSIRKATMACFVNPTCQVPAGAQFMECTVLVSHEASSDNELTVKKGEVVTVLSRETTGWSLVMKPKVKGSKESEALGYVPSSFLKQKEDKAGLENTQELDKECLGFLSSVAAQKEARWLNMYGSFNGFSSSYTSSSAGHVPLPNLREVLLSESDDHDESAEKSPTGQRNEGFANGHNRQRASAFLPSSFTDPDDPDDSDNPDDSCLSPDLCGGDTQCIVDDGMRNRRNDFTRRGIQAARRKALAIKSANMDCERRTPSPRVGEDMVSDVPTSTSSI